MAKRIPRRRRKELKLRETQSRQLRRRRLLPEKLSARCAPGGLFDVFASVVIGGSLLEDEFSDRALEESLLGVPAELSRMDTSVGAGFNTRFNGGGSDAGDLLAEVESSADNKSLLSTLDTLDALRPISSSSIGMHSIDFAFASFGGTLDASDGLFESELTQPSLLASLNLSGLSGPVSQPAATPSGSSLPSSSFDSSPPSSGLETFGSGASPGLAQGSFESGGGLSQHSRVPVDFNAQYNPHYADAVFAEGEGGTSGGTTGGTTASSGTHYGAYKCGDAVDSIPATEPPTRWDTYPVEIPLGPGPTVIDISTGMPVASEANVEWIDLDPNAYVVGDDTIDYSEAVNDLDIDNNDNSQVVTLAVDKYRQYYTYSLLAGASYKNNSPISTPSDSYTETDQIEVVSGTTVTYTATETVNIGAEIQGVGGGLTSATSNGQQYSNKTATTTTTERTSSTDISKCGAYTIRFTKSTLSLRLPLISHISRTTLGHRVT